MAGRLRGRIGTTALALGLAALVGALAGGCDAIGIGTPSLDDVGLEDVGLEALSPEPYAFTPVPESDPRVPANTVMRFTLPTLDEASSLLFTRINQDEQIFERRRVWRTADPAGVQASIIVRTRTNGREIALADDVRDTIELWPEIYKKTTAFGKLYASRNALGPVQWHRFEAGGQLCVLFQQGIGTNPDEVLRRVVGFYCSAAGDSLTPGQAETVVRSVQLVDRDG